MKKNITGPIEGTHLEGRKTNYNPYSRKVGHKGEDILRWVLEDIYLDNDLNYDLNFVKDVQANGPDIIIRDINGYETAKYEVLNLQRSTRIYAERARDIKKNLHGTRFVGLFVSFPENLTKGAQKILSDVPICYTSMQILPDDIHATQPPNNLYRRKKDGVNSKTFRDLKNRLYSFLWQTNFIPLVTQYTNNRQCNPKKYQIKRSIQTFFPIQVCFPRLQTEFSSIITPFSSPKPRIIDHVTKIMFLHVQDRTSEDFVGILAYYNFYTRL